MIKGNFGKLLDVNLTDGTLLDYTVPEDYYREYLGGKGLGARLLWDLLPNKGNTDPYGPENVLVLLVGPLVGQSVTGSGRYVVMTKSPLAKFVAEAYGGGYFPATLKSTGYDGIIIRGKSVKPVYLELIDGSTKLVNAEAYWGKGVFEVHDSLLKIYGNGVKTALIGQAGENRVRYAAIINDKNRAAARGGVGAVLGSKMIKGVVARGDKTAELADKQTFKTIRSEFRSTLLDEDKMNMKDGFGTYGTSGGIPTLHKMNILPTKNFQQGQYEGHNLISGQFMEESELLVGRDNCYSCAVSCKRVIDGEYKDHKLLRDGSSLEYETLASFGSLLDNNNVKLVGLANQLCNDYGLDTISTGVSIAYAMEATEKGLAEKIGLSLKWGDDDQIIDTIHKIAHREGYGDEIAEGVWRMSNKIGGDYFAIHTKGMELAMHEPRGKVGLGLSYAVSPRGGSHMEGLHDTMLMRENASPKLGLTVPRKRISIEGKPKAAIVLENATSFTNSLIICAFDVAKTGKYYNMTQLQSLTSAAMGMEINTDEMLNIGERIYNMWRMVAVREGLTAIDDDLPERFKQEALEYDEGSSAITQEKLDIMLKEYYDLRGWDTDGKPNENTRNRLNLPFFQ